ncbi:TerC family protein [Dongshaea marina]|uniref:TerC family protein n=1 Tax=Dongshaea marina TaxID=2047966 RepID=UPI000D3E9B98|nr:CBS domain-containing protein [Dongshaea marina]
MLDFTWFMDPTAWAGLATLVILEIVLGIDNLLFIAILAEKLPPEKRDKARRVGLFLALFIRLGLLACISWLVSLTNPLITVLGHTFSGRDLILLLGGLFLLFKGSMELHERLEGHSHNSEGPRKNFSPLWSVITQIVLLDAVFSLDSVITAVGMADHLSIMMIAVVIAMIIMIIASKPLSLFINAHPTLIILCLSFLLMIGFSLVAEGFGLHIPKGYLYAAIGFSIVIELFNQLAQKKRRKRLKLNLGHRERAAKLVMRMLGEKNGVGEDLPQEVLPEVGQPIFAQDEQQMVAQVLKLGSLPVSAIMESPKKTEMLDLSQSDDKLRQLLASTVHSRLIAIENGDASKPLGIIRKRDVLARLLSKQPLELRSLIQKPFYLTDSSNLLEAMRALRANKTYLALVRNAQGEFVGITTVRDLMEEIAGDFDDDESELPLTPAY